MRKLLAMVSLVALATAGASASDFDFGSTARSTAMGGAGIALGDDSGTLTMLNPAAPACAGARFRFIFPGLTFHTTGATFGDLADRLDKIGGSSEDALSLVNDFARQRTTLSLGMVTGITGPMGVTVEAQANGIVNPSAEASKWASAAQQFSDTRNLNLSTLQATLNNSNFDAAVSAALAGNTSAADAAFDRYLDDLNQTYVNANVAYGPGFLIGKGFETANGRLWLGTNVKVLVTQGKTWQIRGQRVGSLRVSGGSVLADLDFSADEIQDNKRTTTMKADVGMIYKPNDSVLQYGLVVNNFIKPKLRGLTESREDLMISGGIAAVVGRSIIVAADLVNITGANGEKAKLRMGAEFRLGRLFAARVGYSGSQWTTGIEVLGINIAWAGRTAQFLTNVLKF
ncbi:MAG: conjugal transfer protein TraF [Armatimonadota bacterium]